MTSSLLTSSFRDLLAAEQTDVGNDYHFMLQVPEDTTVEGKKSPGIKQVESDHTLVQQPWHLGILAKREFIAKTQIQGKVYLESHRSRSELWKKWVQETSYRGKSRAFGTQEKERGRKTHVGGGSGGKAQAHFTESSFAEKLLRNQSVSL